MISMFHKPVCLCDEIEARFIHLILSQIDLSPLNTQTKDLLETNGMVDWLVGLIYDISTIVGYLMLNPIFYI